MRYRQQKKPAPVKGRASDRAGIRSGALRHGGQRLGLVLRQVIPQKAKLGLVPHLATHRHKQGEKIFATGERDKSRAAAHVMDDRQRNRAAGGRRNRLCDLAHVRHVSRIELRDLAQILADGFLRRGNAPPVGECPVNRLERDVAQCPDVAGALKLDPQTLVSGQSFLDRVGRDDKGLSRV
jgi:hypothetical protein